MKKIFLTGVAGFIGSVVAEQLISEGFEVVGIDNFKEGNRSSVRKDIVFYEGDYGDKALLRSIFNVHKIDCVFHFAAETTIEYSMTNPSIYFNNNVINGINLLDTMLSFDIKNLVFSSTAAVYGEPLYTPIDESHEKKPVNSYGASKLMFEDILDWYRYAYGIRYNLFRYFNAAGATKEAGENRKHENHLLPLVFKSILDDKYILNVYGNDYKTKDGTCVRDYVHVKDIARAHLLAMSNFERIPDGRYNLGSSSGFTILEVIDNVEKVTKRRVKWQYQSRRLGDPAVLVASNKKAIDELGWKMDNSNLELIIIDAYNWFIRQFRRK